VAKTREVQKFTKGTYLVREKPILRGVDATPDGGYALRILKAYRHDNEGYVTDNSNGDPPESEFLKMLNETNDQRKVELDKAIKILEASPKGGVSGTTNARRG